MSFADLVREHHLNVCIVSEIACPECFRIFMLTTEPLPHEIDCPACGKHSRVFPQRVRAATSRPLPRMERLRWRPVKAFPKEPKAQASASSRP